LQKAKNPSNINPFFPKRIRNRKPDEERVGQEMVGAVKLIKAQATPWEINEISAAAFTSQETREVFTLNSPLWRLIKGLLLNVKDVEERK